jgi:hypothetical protein
LTNSAFGGNANLSVRSKVSYDFIGTIDDILAPPMSRRHLFIPSGFNDSEKRSFAAFFEQQYLVSTHRI